MSGAGITLPFPAGFSLKAGSRFLMDFPAGQGGEDAATLNLAFALDGGWKPV